MTKGKKMTTPIDGYKTYIAMLLTIATAVFFYLRGDLPPAAAMGMITLALGQGALRHGNGS